MANARKYAGSSYIRLDDVYDKPPLHEQIAVVKEEDGKFGQRLVLVFESGRQLSLNKTSVGVLINEISPDFDTWTGHRVEVYAGEVDFQHGKADAVLVRTPSTAKRAAAPGDMDDEIPF
jgi:hypothetical protein